MPELNNVPDDKKVDTRANIGDQTFTFCNNDVIYGYILDEKL